MSTFPGEQPEHIPGQLSLNEPVPQDDERTYGDALGPCGCVDYHMADCDGSAAMSKDDYLDLYSGYDSVDDWPDSYD